MNQIQTLKEFLDDNFRFYNVKQEIPERKLKVFKIESDKVEQSKAAAATNQNINKCLVLRNFIFGVR